MSSLSVAAAKKVRSTANISLIWGGVEKLEAPEFYERDVPTCQFNFEWAAVA
jgi:hypothetical protein